MRTAASDAPTDAGQLLQGLAPLLTAPSLDTSLAGAVRLVVGLAGCELAGLLILKGDDVASEHWHGDDALTVTLRGEIVRSSVLASRERTGSVRVVESPGGQR